MAKTNADSFGTFLETLQNLDVKPATAAPAPSRYVQETSRSFTGKTSQELARPEDDVLDRVLELLEKSGPLTVPVLVAKTGLGLTRCLEGVDLLRRYGLVGTVETEGLITVEITPSGSLAQSSRPEGSS